MQSSQQAVEACLSAEARAMSYQSESDVTTWMSGFMRSAQGSGHEGLWVALLATGCLGQEALLTAHPARAVTANAFVALSQDILQVALQALQAAAAGGQPPLLRAATRGLRCLLAAGTALRYIHQLQPGIFPALMGCMAVDAGAVCSFLVDALTPLAAEREGGGVAGVLSFSSSTSTAHVHGLPTAPASLEDRLASASCVGSMVSPFVAAASAVQPGTDAEQAFYNAASGLARAGVQSSAAALQAAQSKPGGGAPSSSAAVGGGGPSSPQDAHWLSHASSDSAGGTLMQILSNGCRAGDLRCRALSFEAWAQVAALPLEGCGSLLRQSALWASLLQATLDGVKLPSEFSSWDECEMDEDEFERFREQDAVELFGALCMRLGCAEVLAAAVQQVTSQAQVAQQWIQVEAALFLVRAVHLQVKGSLRHAAKTGGGPGAQGGATQLHSVLQSLFSQLSARPAAVTAHSACISAACKCLFYYSGWLAQHGELLSSSATLAMDSLGVPLAAEAAASALLALTSRASKLFAKGDSIRRLAQGVGTCLVAGAPVAAASNLVSAIMRVLTQVPPVESSAILRQLLAEFSSRVSSGLAELAAGASGDAAQQAAGSCEAGLTLLAEATRFSGGLKASDEANPLLVAAEATMAVCAQVLPAAAGTHACAPASVHSAACAALAALLTAEQGRYTERLEAILTMAVHAYRQHALPEAAGLVNTCIEYFGEGSVAAGGGASAVIAASRPALDAMLQAAVQGILQQALSSPSEKQLSVAVYELGWGCMMRHPSALLQQQDTAAALYARAAAALQAGPGQQRSLRSSLSFVSRFVAPLEAWQRAGSSTAMLQALQASRGTVDAVVDAHGRSMLQGLLHVILHQAHGASVIDPAAEALFQHLTAYHSACAQLVQALLQDAGGAGGLPLPPTPLWSTVKAGIAQVLVSFATPEIAAESPSGAMAFLAETPLDRYKHAVGVVSTVAAGAAGSDALEQLQLPGTKGGAAGSSSPQVPRGAISFM